MEKGADVSGMLSGKRQSKVPKWWVTDLRVEIKTKTEDWGHWDRHDVKGEHED